MTEIQSESYTAAFTGHKIIAKAKLAHIAMKLDETIGLLINRGINSYMVGGALGFDTHAATAVLKAREHNPKIRLFMVLPCADQDSRWRESEKIAYRHLLNNADEVIYVSEQPYFKGCMELRNRYLIEHSSILIAYMTHRRSGSSQTVRLALENGLTVINLAETKREEAKMERYSARTIDELNRIVIHSELRQKLGLETGIKVSLQVIDTIVVMRKTDAEAEKDCYVSQVSDLGMIELPAELRKQMSWKTADKIALYNTDNLIILKTA